MFYVYNPTNETLIDPQTGISVQPGEVKKFDKSKEMAFLRLISVFNGVVRVVDENFYNQYLQKKTETTHFETTLTQEENEEQPKKKGRQKKLEENNNSLQENI